MKDHLSIEVDQTGDFNKVTITFTPVTVNVNVDIDEADGYESEY